MLCKHACFDLFLNIPCHMQSSIKKYLITLVGQLPWEFVAAALLGSLRNAVTVAVPFEIIVCDVTLSRSIAVSIVTMASKLYCLACCCCGRDTIIDAYQFLNWAEAYA